MYTGLLHTHSLLRYVVLILLLIAIIKAVSGWLNKKDYTPLDNKLSLWSMIVLHVQLLIGFGLYFVSPYVTFERGMEVMKITELRYWTVEHAIMMILGIAAVTIGRIIAKRKTEALEKHRTTAIYFIIGLVLILSRIPFPFTTVSRDWLPFMQ